jgi:hypothetical protein
MPINKLPQSDYLIHNDQSTIIVSLAFCCKQTMKQATRASPRVETTVPDSAMRYRMPASSYKVLTVLYTKATPQSRYVGGPINSPLGTPVTVSTALYSAAQLSRYHCVAHQIPLVSLASPAF